MARPREFDEEIVIDAIKNVFWNKGFGDTSYADLIEASGLHKGSLYAAFGDKRALYLRSLQSYDEHEVADAIVLLSGKDGSRVSGKKRIEALLNAVINAVALDDDRRGCLLCNASVDQAPHNKEVEKAVTNSLEKLQQAFEAALAPTDKGVALRETASLCHATYFGMRVMAKSGAPISLMKSARNGALKSI